MGKQVQKNDVTYKCKMTEYAVQKMKEEVQRKIPEAALLDIEQMNKSIDRMSDKEVNDYLCSYSANWDTFYSSKTHRKKLKKVYKALTLSTINFSVSRRLLPYYVVIDFEATCEEQTPPDFKPEIIEFGAVIVSSKRQMIIDCFQMYCKPQINPILSKYCRNLTGISQESVDSADTFDVVFKCFHSWIRGHNIGKFGLVTDGPWDTARYLFNQCYHSNLPFPAWGRKWINLKTVFRYFYKDFFVEKPVSLSLYLMLDYLEIEFKGRQHCGLDDAWNLARVLLVLIYEGANIHFNEKMKGLNNSQRGNRHKKGKENGFKHEFCVTKDKNIVRAQFRSERSYSGPSPTYYQCKKEKNKQQYLVASKMFNLQ